MELDQLTFLPVGGLTLEPPMPLADFDAAKKRNRLRGLPKVDGTAAERRLAIVGSGMSIRDRLQEIRHFDGEIWSINGANEWLRAQGIESTFFSVDPTLSILGHVKHVSRAVLQPQVHPDVFDQLALNWADVKIFDPGMSVGGFSATGAAFAGIAAGYKEIVFFGCECSHMGDQTHVHLANPDEQAIAVEVAGKLFLTRTAYYWQAFELASILRAFPTVMQERSGGMLGAIVALPAELGADPGVMPA